MNLNFLYCFDNNFNQQAMTSICSLLDKTTIKINLYIIHNDIEELKNWLQPVEQHPMILSINIYDFNDLDTDTLYLSTLTLLIFFLFLNCLFILLLIFFIISFYPLFSV